MNEDRKAFVLHDFSVGELVEELKRRDACEWVSIPPDGKIEMGVRGFATVLITYD